MSVTRNNLQFFWSSKSFIYFSKNPDLFWKFHFLVKGKSQKWSGDSGFYFLSCTLRSNREIAAPSFPSTTCRCWIFDSPLDFFLFAKQLDVLTFARKHLCWAFSTAWKKMFHSLGLHCADFCFSLTFLDILPHATFLWLLHFSLYCINGFYSFACRFNPEHFSILGDTSQHWTSKWFPLHSFVKIHTFHAPLIQNEKLLEFCRIHFVDWIFTL